MGHADDCRQRVGDEPQEIGEKRLEREREWLFDYFEEEGKTKNNKNKTKGQAYVARREM